jgi:hypothetical protein
MGSSANGERYTRIFRKAGVYLVKGNLARALEVLKEGRDLAVRERHSKMARLFTAEMERAKAPGDAEKEISQKE